MRELLSKYKYISLQKFYNEILNSSNDMKLPKLHFLAKAASGELDDEKVEPYRL